MGRFLRMLGKGMTYEGEFRDVVINYTLIILVLLPFVLTGSRVEGPTDWGWAACLAIALIIQIVLWFIARATGVSIIWSALAGYTLLEFWNGGMRSVEQNTLLALLALSSAGAAIIYYALTYPLITTIAHICAVILGIGVWFVLR